MNVCIYCIQYVLPQYLYRIFKSVYRIGDRIDPRSQNPDPKRKKNIPTLDPRSIPDPRIFSEIDYGLMAYTCILKSKTKI